MKLRFCVTDYERGELDDPENCATTAELTVKFGEQVLTRHDDPRAKSVRKGIRVSTYPLAHWLASVYWRLCYEPQPDRPPTAAWRLAHELAAAGDGYQWPQATFVPDGEEMLVCSIASPTDGVRSANYLDSVRGRLPVGGFICEVQRFVNEVLERLDAVEMPGTDLAKIWDEVTKESGDPELARYRIIEARLGYDPDVVAEEIVRAFLREANVIGASALDEIAPLCGTERPVATLSELEGWAAQQNLRGRINFPALDVTLTKHCKASPWERGQELARAARNALRLNGGKIEDSTLAGWMGLTETQGFAPPPHKTRYRLSLGIRDGSAITYALTKPHRQARRFELARLLGDNAAANPTEAWLPLTNTSTARQRVQRAFAAELLCPIDALQEYLDGDYSDDGIDAAIEHFDVQERVIENQLVKHQVLPRSILGNRSEGFPYRIA